MKKMTIYTIALSTLIGCSTSNNAVTFNDEYKKCANFVISGDNEAFKNMQIFAKEGQLYFKTAKLATVENVSVYAISSNNQYVPVSFTTNNSYPDYTIFKTPEGFSAYALKNTYGGSVKIVCNQ